MRILWLSDSPFVTSAYGQQAALFLPRLRAVGHEVSVSARDELGRVVSPHASGASLNFALRDGTSVRSWDRGPVDRIVSLCDPHVLDAAAWAEHPWVAWTPVDCDPPYEGTIRALRGARRVLAMSRHGERLLRAAGIACDYVPHGIDAGVFCPGDRDAAREAIGRLLGRDLRGKFLACSVAANASRGPSRKGFAEMFAAWRAFSDRRTDAVLYVHTEVTGGERGEDLTAILKDVGLGSDCVLFPPQYPLVSGLFKPEHLAVLYRAADAYLSAAHGEGFGIPIVEAQACGCPVIVPRNTAQTELARAGQVVDAIPYAIHGASMRARPVISALVEALDVAYGDRGRRCDPSVVGEFAVDRVFPLLEVAITREL